MDSRFQGIETYVINAFVAAQRSRVTRKRMGSLLVGRLRDSRVWNSIADGCNGVASNQPHDFELEGVTLPTVLHAEQNVMLKLGLAEARTSIDYDIYDMLVLIVMSAPCPMCAEEIITQFTYTHTDLLDDDHNHPETIMLDAVLYVDSYRDGRGLLRLGEVGIECVQVAEYDLDVMLQATRNVEFELRLARFINRNLQQNLMSLSRKSAAEDKEEYYLFARDFMRQTTEEFNQIIGNIQGIDWLRSMRYALLTVGENLRAVGCDATLYNKSVCDAFNDQLEKANIHGNTGPVTDVVFRVKLHHNVNVGIALVGCKNEAGNNWSVVGISFVGDFDESQLIRSFPNYSSSAHYTIPITGENDNVG